MHFPALTGLRFLLALWVILHHLTGRGMMLEAWSLTLPLELANIVRGGYLAVGTFFVLSGFVLARAHASPEWSGASLFRYGVSRFARVYPVYVLSLAVMLPFIFESRVAGKSGLLTNYGLLLQGWSGLMPVSWNTPAWSLSCEIFFYLCFPFFAIALGRLRWTSVLAATVVACLIPGVLRMLSVPNAWKPLFHLSDFVVGIVAARALDLLLRSGNPLTGRGHWFYVPGLASGATLIAYPGVLGGIINLNSALRPLNALVLVGLALGGGLLAGGLSCRLIVFLGKASYSMYILHIPLLWWYLRLGPPLLTWIPGVVLALVYLAWVVMVAAVVFRYVEEPANRYLRQRMLAPSQAKA